MSNKQKVSTTRITRSLATILLAGGTAGAIDFIHATVIAVAGGGSALRVLKGVAAALFGVQAIVDVGDAMAIVGAGLHFLITIVAAAIYFLVAQRVGWLLSHRMLAGVVYGFLFWAAMNYVIIPLSVIGHPVYVGTKVICFAILTHIIEIGLPTSFIIAWRVNARPVPRDKVQCGEQAV